MRFYALLISLCIVWVFLFTGRSSLCPHEAPRKAIAKPNPIEGEWIVICYDLEGGVQSMLPDTGPTMPGQLTKTSYYGWKITKETIERGPDKKDWFPRYRYTYKLNPDNQEGAIDLIPLDKEKGKKKNDKQKKQLAIYFVKGDYLMISFGRNTRPKNFTTSKENPNWVYILRRGKLQFADSGSEKPKRKDK